MTASILRFSGRPQRAKQEYMETFLPAGPWVCPDQHSRRDLIGFAFTYPTGPDHPTHAEVDPADWSAAKSIAAIEFEGDLEAADQIRANTFPNTRVLAFWTRPERRKMRPDGLLLFRTVGDCTASEELSGITVFIDYCWLAPVFRGLKYSHYFACYLRAFVFWHPIHPWYPPAGQQAPVAEDGVAVRLVAPHGPGAWNHLCHNIAAIFSMNMSMWKSDRERGREAITPYPAKWAVERLQLEVPHMPLGSDKLPF